MTIQEIQEEIINEFKIFDSLIDKYAYLVKLGKNSSSMDMKFKVDQNLIRGCQLTTWYSSKFEDDLVYYEIDSSSAIIKGALSLLKKIFSGQKPKDIINAKLYFVDKAGLQEFFSPIRANSLWKIENKIRQSAAAYETNIKTF